MTTSSITKALDKLIPPAQTPPRGNMIRARVIAVQPLRIQLYGSTAPLPWSPEDYIGSLSVNDTVMCLIDQGGQVYVIARNGGPKIETTTPTTLIFTPVLSAIPTNSTTVRIGKLTADGDFIDAELYINIGAQLSPATTTVRWTPPTGYAPESDVNQYEPIGQIHLYKAGQGARTFTAIAGSNPANIVTFVDPAPATTNMQYITSTYPWTWGTSGIMIANMRYRYRTT